MNFRISPKDGVCSWIIHSSIFQTAGPMWVQHDIIQVYFLNWLLNGFIKVYTCWFPWQRSKYFFCITTGAASLLHSKLLFNSKHKLFESSSPSSALSVQIRSLFFIQSFKLEYISGPMLHAFTCYRNYRKYKLPSRKLDMNGLREALYGQFPTRKLVFTIIPIARECSII